MLIAGLGLDLESWPSAMVAQFVERGFRVIRADNRDAGRSTLVSAPAPSVLRQLLARPRADAYSLADMAADHIGVLDHLEVDRVHLLGMSMGGMIAQTIAATQPGRVATLTSLFSTTGNSAVGQPRWSTKWILAKPAPRTVRQAVERHLELFGRVASTTCPPNWAAEREWATKAWFRGPGRQAHQATARQIGAIQASGDRTDELRRITAPTLVIHGGSDRLVHPAAERRRRRPSPAHAM
ncbi:alpha/beta fold hydrolase [Nocardia sp. NPDC050406]|uniref:alpha/beta fold hydrolase n=1 Tax=Nocardia sp. NPDC050406 TaxID=3364318 RepID=UPI003796AFBE